MAQHGTALYHFSYHKCLTVYFKGVMRKVFLAPDRLPGHGYEHVNSRLDRFWSDRERYRLISVNNHFVDPAELERHGPFRASRFVRDPRDLLVSGYLYHRRGTEKWLHVRDPRDADWAVVNGAVPPTLTPGSTYTEYLNAVPQEEGLLAELAFRRHHFEGMSRWPDDPRVLVVRYEDLLGDEHASYERVLRHYGVNPAQRAIGLRYADRLSAGSAGVRGDKHVRDPRPKQWLTLLTPTVLDAFDRAHPDLLDRTGYR